MSTRYSLEIIISHDSLEKPLFVEIKDTNLASLKADIKPTVELLCYEKGIKGTVQVGVVIGKSGKYIENKDYEFVVD